MWLPRVQKGCVQPHEIEDIAEQQQQLERNAPPSPFKPLSHIAIKKKTTILPALFRSKLESKLRRSELYDVMFAAEHKVAASHKARSNRPWQLENNPIGKENISLDNLTTRVNDRRYCTTNHLEELSPLLSSALSEQTFNMPSTLSLNKKQRLSYVQEFELFCEQQRMFFQRERWQRQEIITNAELCFTKITVKFMQTLPFVISTEQQEHFLIFTDDSNNTANNTIRKSADDSANKQQEERELFLVAIEERTKATLTATRNATLLHKQIEAVMPTYNELRTLIIDEEEREFNKIVEWERTHHPYGPGCFQITSSISHTCNHNHNNNNNNEYEYDYKECNSKTERQYEKQHAVESKKILHDAKRKSALHVLQTTRSNTNIPLINCKQSNYESAKENKFAERGRERLQRDKALVDLMRINANAINELSEEECFEREMVINEESVEWIPLLEDAVDGCYHIVEHEREQIAHNKLNETNNNESKHNIKINDIQTNISNLDHNFYNDTSEVTQKDLMITYNKNCKNNNNNICNVCETIVKDVNISSGITNHNNILCEDNMSAYKSYNNNYAQGMKSTDLTSYDKGKEMNSAEEIFSPEYLHNVQWGNYTSKERLVELLRDVYIYDCVQWQILMEKMINNRVEIVKEQIEEVWKLYVLAGSEASVLTETEPGVLCYHGLKLDNALLEYESFFSLSPVNVCEQMYKDKAISHISLANVTINSYLESIFSPSEDARVEEVIV